MSPAKGTDEQTLEERRRLGEKLREARRYMGLTQDEVAQYLKLQRSALSEVEAGSRKVDAIELSRLAKLYRQPVDYFINSDTPVSTLPIDVAHLARQAADLSEEDRNELTRFAEYLTSRSQKQKE